MRKIKREDTVLVIGGRDRGKTGVVRQVVGGGDLVKVKGHRPKIKEDKVFVTGLKDLESRASSIISGGNDFIAKPFLFMELAVKALVYVLRGKLDPDHRPTP